MSTISYADIQATLIAAGYKVTLVPMEQRPPELVWMQYDFDFKTEDVSLQAYMMYNDVTLEWSVLDPTKINAQVLKMMGVLQAAYNGQYHFAMGHGKVSGSGTLHLVSIHVYWRQFVVNGDVVP